MRRVRFPVCDDGRDETHDSTGITSTCFVNSNVDVCREVDSEIYTKPTTGNKTVKLTYHCTDDFGNKCQAREWVAFESKRAKFKVGQWWKRRNGIEPVPKNVQRGFRPESKKANSQCHMKFKSDLHKVGILRFAESK